MSVSSPVVSLIDLSKQLPFEIDDSLKQQLCFAETLVISCGHFDGDVNDDSSDSEWSCEETETSEKLEAVVEHIKPVLPQEIVTEDKKDDKYEEDNDFHFYFFPDCTKPMPPQDSKGSLIVVDGLPKINPNAVKPQFCTCGADKTGKCSCFVKLPCVCGAKPVAECKCILAENICICHKGLPQPICTCRGSDVCVCFDNRTCNIDPDCTCGKVDKPCLCHADKYPAPECTCIYKPTSVDIQDIQSIGEEEGEEQNVKNKDLKNEQHETCVCQKPKLKPKCLCRKGNECICEEDTCVCDVQKSCVCEPVDKLTCDNDESKLVCVCAVTPECTCDENVGVCKCFPKPIICSCGNPENCKCFSICECTEPCICDTQLKKKECLCLDKNKEIVDGICTCAKKGDTDKKLKKVRKGKHGYRWCHDVDPRHTYFDYAYNRHDKISYKETEKEKFKILGLYDEKMIDEKCAVHGEIKAPTYEKKVRKPSIDCCSAVGGISISVETLGEDKDKFLVQIVSHSSKEGAKTGSKVVSILDCNLHTMEENRSEHIAKQDVLKERRSYIAICEGGYYNKVTRICGERSIVKRLYHTYEDAHNFLLEGANIVFIRYLGLRRYKGNVQTETVLMNGSICQSIYVSQGVSQAIVNGSPLFVVKVERHIIEPSGFVHQSLTVVTLRGYMVSHEWADNSYIIHLNPLLRVTPEQDLIEEHAPLRENWREDLQLLSDYLEYKSSRSSEAARYLQENGALTNVIRDYLQALLLLRPQDALHFTRHYFGTALSAVDLPHDEYFDPTVKHVRYFFFEE